MLLIVDDDMNYQSAMERLFDGKTLPAMSVEEGLDMARTQRAQVAAVLLDNRFPSSDRAGLDAVQRFRHALPHAPVVLVSALGSEAEALEAGLLGCAGYVDKTNTGQLMATIAKALTDALAKSLSGAPARPLRREAAPRRARRVHAARRRRGS